MSTLKDEPEHFWYFNTESRFCGRTGSMLRKHRPIEVVSNMTDRYASEYPLPGGVDEYLISRQPLNNDLHEQDPDSFARHEDDQHRYGIGRRERGGRRTDRCCSQGDDFPPQVSLSPAGLVGAGFDQQLTRRHAGDDNKSRNGFNHPYRYRNHPPVLTTRLRWRRPETVASSQTQTAAHVQPSVRDSQPQMRPRFPPNGYIRRTTTRWRPRRKCCFESPSLCASIQRTLRVDLL